MPISQNPAVRGFVPASPHYKPHMVRMRPTRGKNRAQIRKGDAVILGVSVDSVASHQAFCAKEGLSFKLLSDPGARVSTKYGSVMENKGTRLSARNTFIIGPNGKIARVFLKVKPSGHSEEVQAALIEQQKR